MIRIDDRIGSRQLVELLPASVAKLQRLPYADAEFTTEQGHLIGFELKTLDDLLNCISTGRFGGHQLPGLTCRFNIAYLLITGLWRRGRDGVLEVPRRRGWVPQELAGRRFMWQDVEQWITTVEVYSGVKVRRVATDQEAAALIYAKWLWWGKGAHHSHQVFDESITGTIPLREPSLLRYMASRLPGIGWVKSAAVEREFSSVVEMVNADEKRWQQIDGVGTTLSKRIVDALEQGREKS